VIAAVNGIAAGAGASIALACDFRIASEHAKLVLAFVKVGLVPDSGAVWFLTKLVGAGKAFEICALGNPVGADDALRLGLFNRVVPADNFSDTWKNFADTLASGPTRAYALTKALANFAMVRSLDEQLDGEVEAQSQAGHTQDHMEGVTAFFEKRAPHFLGR
jgi:2-(1,2-epoxy-1,2-dihydrophenyl)acetyl-CoA isomerase